ncbi:MAG: hypothetical protein ABH878_10660 [bacterium]
MKSSRWSWLALIAILAALWAALELVVGTTLYALRVPLRGQMLTVFTLPIMLAARWIVPQRGSVAAVGVIAAAVRWLLGGAFAPQISLAIILEAAFVELGLGRVQDAGISRWKAALAGALCMSYSAAHPILFWGLLMGGGRDVKLPVGLHGMAIFGGILLIHFSIGALVGLWSLLIIKKIPVPALHAIRVKANTAK